MRIGVATGKLREGRAALNSSIMSKAKGQLFGYDSHWAKFLSWTDMIFGLRSCL